MVYRDIWLRGACVFCGGRVIVASGGLEEQRLSMNESENQQLEPRAKVGQISGVGTLWGVRCAMAMLCAVLGVVGYFRMQDQADRQRDASITPTSLIAVPRELGFENVRSITRGEVPSVHSATAVELDGGRIRAYWFGGSREGARDVSIWTAEWDGAHIFKAQLP